MMLELLGYALNAPPLLAPHPPLFQAVLALFPNRLLDPAFSGFGEDVNVFKINVVVHRHGVRERSEQRTAHIAGVPVAPDEPFEQHERFIWDKDYPRNMGGPLLGSF